MVHVHRGARDYAQHVLLTFSRFSTAERRCCALRSAYWSSKGRVLYTNVLSCLQFWAKGFMNMLSWGCWADKSDGFPFCWASLYRHTAKPSRVFPSSGISSARKCPLCISGPKSIRRNASCQVWQGHRQSLCSVASWKNALTNNGQCSQVCGFVKCELGMENKPTKWLKKRSNLICFMTRNFKSIALLIRSAPN